MFGKWIPPNQNVSWVPKINFNYVNQSPNRKQHSNIQFSSIQLLSHVHLFVTPWTAACQASLSFTSSQSSPNPCPLSWWCHPTISSSIVPFSSCPQSFPASGSFPMSKLFASGGQSTGVSASTSFLPMNIQDWSPLGWTGWIPCSPRDSQESSPTPQFKRPGYSQMNI